MNAAVAVYDSATLPRRRVDQISALKDRVWSVGAGLDEMYALHLQRCDRRPRRQTLLIVEDDAVLAHAELFERTIRVGALALAVGALAGVCVQPERQGEGLGRVIVRHAFARVDGGGLPLLLFQTDSAGFYRKLGARTVANRFYDSRAADPHANPWWGENVMIYPAGYPWPLVDVDLNGPGY